MKKESYEQTSARLNRSALATGPAELSQFLEDQKTEFLTGRHPFSDYMRLKFREKGVLQQSVFLAADLSERYGYKLISGEKRTRQRDVIIRLCLAAGFRQDELREALLLYGMAPLHARFPRDAVLIVAVQHGICDLQAVNRLLREHGMEPLLSDYE